MLVLSRQRYETIMIGDDVGITVVDIQGGKVQFGITAPRHVQIHRQEVYEAIHRGDRSPAGLGTSVGVVVPASIDLDLEVSR